MTLYAYLRPRSQERLNSEYILWLRHFTVIWFSGFACAEIVILNMNAESFELDNRIFELDQNGRSIFTGVWCLLHSAQLAFGLVYLDQFRKMWLDCIQFIGITALFDLAFIRSFMLFFNANTTDGCVSEYSNHAISFYHVILAFVNMEDYRKYDVIFKPILFLNHVMFVSLVCLLVYSLLIASMTDAMNALEQNKHLEMRLTREYFARELHSNLLTIPTLGKFYGRWRDTVSRKSFVHENGRIFILGRTSTH